MDSVEWSNSVRRELYPAGQARENSFEEFKTRLLSTNGPGLSTGQLTERFHALHQREGQTNEQYAQEVAEVGRRAGVSERDLVARFARGITSKQAYLAMRLQEPQTLAEARKLVSKVVQAEEDFHQSRQSDTRNPKPEKTELEGQKLTAVRPAGKRDSCFNCRGLAHQDAEPNVNQRARRAADMETAGCWPWPDCKKATRHL
ncbi:Pyruvate kinase [Trichinella pseudospiralis]